MKKDTYRLLIFIPVIPVIAALLCFLRHIYRITAPVSYPTVTVTATETEAAKPLSEYRQVTFYQLPTRRADEISEEDAEEKTTSVVAVNNNVLTDDDYVEKEEPVAVTEEDAVTESSGQSDNEDDVSHGKSLGFFTCTAYCGCTSCSEGYGNMTATGVYARANHTIAVDPSVIPYGTWVVINNITYKAEDCGGDIIGRTIDIYFDNHSETEEFGVRTYEVFLA